MSQTLTVVYCTSTPFLDTALNRIRSLAKVVDLHVLIEVAPESWCGSMFDAAPRRLPEGIQDGMPVLAKIVPPGVMTYLDAARSVQLAVYTQSRSVHPATMLTSWRLGRHVAGLGADIVHLDDIGIRRSWGLRALGAVPLVVSVHDPIAHSGERDWRRSLARWLAFRRARRFILHNDHCVNAFCARYGISPSRVDVSLLGSCEVLRQWSGDDRHATGESIDLLCFGRLSPYKGIDILAEAAQIISEAVRGVRIVVAGSSAAGFVAPPSRDLANGGRFTVEARHISNAEAAALFGRAKAVVLPYRDATQSGVALSAIAFGRPVIATRCGGLPEYVLDGHNGLLVESRSPAAIAAACIRILSEPRLLQALADGATKDCEQRLSWDRVAAEHVESYMRCLADLRRCR